MVRLTEFVFVLYHQNLNLKIPSVNNETGMKAFFHSLKFAFDHFVQLYTFDCVMTVNINNHISFLGVMTSMCIDPSQSWLAVGTDNGVFICWDLRFRLPVASLTHPSGARVLRLVCHPTQPSCFISAVHSNNEVSVWDWENQSRSLALWASSTPPLSASQGVGCNAHGCFAGFRAGNSPFVLTGGSDLRLRYWDLTHPEQSTLISAGAYDPVKHQDLSYK